MKQVRRLSRHKIHKIFLQELRFRKRANFWTEPTEYRARISESEKKGRRLRVTRWSALRPANVIGRTLIAYRGSRRQRGTKSWRKTEGSISEPIFQPKIWERPPRIFSYYLEAIHLSPLPLVPLFSSSSADSGIDFVRGAQYRYRVVLFFVRLGIGFSNAITNYESNRRTSRNNTDVSSTTFSLSDRYLDGRCRPYDPSSLTFLCEAITQTFAKRICRQVNILEFNGAPQIAGNSANGAWCQGLNRVAWFEAERSTGDRQFDVELHATKQESQAFWEEPIALSPTGEHAILSHEIGSFMKNDFKIFSDLYRDKKI